MLPEWRAWVPAQDREADVFQRPILFIGIVAALLIATLMGGPIWRNAEVPDAVRYVPRDASTVTVTPSIGKLVSSISHIAARHYPKEPNCYDDIFSPLTFLEYGLLKTDCWFKDQFGITLSAYTQKEAELDTPEIKLIDERCVATDGLSGLPASLDRSGIDLDQPVVIATRGPVAAGDLVAIVPISNPDCFVGLMNLAIHRSNTRVGQFTPKLNEETIVDLLAEDKDTTLNIARAPQRDEIRFADDWGNSGTSDTTHGLRVAKEVDGIAPSKSARIYPMDAPCSTAALDHTLPLFGLDGSTRPFVLASRVPQSGGPRIDEVAYRLVSSAPPPGVNKSGPLITQPTTATRPSTIKAEVDTPIGPITVQMASWTLCFAFLDKKTAVLFTRLESFLAALEAADKPNRLVHEAGYRLLHKKLPSAVGRTPLLAWSYLKQPGVFLGQPIGVGLYASNTDIRIRSWISPNFQYSKVLQALFATDQTRFASLPDNRRTNVSLDIRNVQMNKQVRDLADLFPEVAKAIELEFGKNLNGRYADVPQSLTSTEHEINNSAVLFAGYREQTPLVVMRFNLNQQDALSSIFHIRSTQRQRRDATIIALAREAHQSDATASQETLSTEEFDQLLDQLFTQNRITVETPNLFPRLKSGVYLPDDFDGRNYGGCLEPPRLSNQEWQVAAGQDRSTICRSGFSYHYLFPPVGTNDFRYRFTDDSLRNRIACATDQSICTQNNQSEGREIDPSKLATEQQLSEVRELLRRDFYRMVAVYDKRGSQLYIGPDLEAVLQILPSKPASSGIDHGTEFAVELDPSWLTRETLLVSQHSDYRYIFENLFVDFADYSSISAKIQSQGNDEGLIVEINASQ